MDYKERLLNELLELTIRIVKLDSFLSGNNINDKEKLDLMGSQLNVMVAYREILEKRILLEMN